MRSPVSFRIDSNLGPEQRFDAFEAALVKNSPVQRCGVATAAATTSPVRAPRKRQAHAPSLAARWTGKTCRRWSAAMISGSMAARMGKSLRRARIARPKVRPVGQNLSAASPLQRQGSVFYVSGNAPHQGGMDQTYVLLEPSKRAVQIGQWERRKLFLYKGSGQTIPLPADIAALRAKSPPERAVAAPVTPGELVPVNARLPLAYISAAASPDIISFSLFCENGRPFMVMLLNKPSKYSSITANWVFPGGLVNIALARGNRESTF